MNEIQVIPQKPAENTGAGCLPQLGWLFSGFVMPLGSFTFYRKATRKSVGTAILFFFLFTLTASFLTSLGVARTLFSVSEDIRTSFEDGTVPNITISKGVAEVEGKQPVIFLDDYDSSGNRILVAIDTTGEIRNIDRDRYDQGFLLTKTELHILNENGQYDVLSLSDLHNFLNKDPIIINADTASQGWQIFSIVSTIFVFIALAIWNSIVRLMFISMIALVLWGIVSLILPNTNFGPIIISGIYALVPALYIYHLFERAWRSLFGVQTLLFMFIWLITLFISLSPLDFFARERPLRLWRALLGLPLLVVMAVDLVLTFNYGAIISWALMILTVIIFATIGIIPLIKTEQTYPPEPPTISNPPTNPQ